MDYFMHATLERPEASVGQIVGQMRLIDGRYYFLDRGDCHNFITNFDGLESCEEVESAIDIAMVDGIDSHDDHDCDLLREIGLLD